MDLDPEPVHPVIVDRATWEQAQRTGAERGNVRDPETPRGRRGRRYVLRSRIRCRACQRRMCGTWRASSSGAVYVYYRCPHNPADPRHTAAHPDHGPDSVREDTMLTALGQFFDTYVFGYDRASLLATLLPATDADHAETQARHAARLRTELARIDTAERGLISELEQPADPGDPAARPTGPASANASPSCTPSAPAPRPGSPSSRPPPRTTTTPACSTPYPLPPGS